MWGGPGLSCHPWGGGVENGRPGVTQQLVSPRMSRWLPTCPVPFHVLRPRTGTQCATFAVPLSLSRPRAYLRTLLGLDHTQPQTSLLGGV